MKDWVIWSCCLIRAPRDFRRGPRAFKAQFFTKSFSKQSKQAGASVCWWPLHGFGEADSWVASKGVAGTDGWYRGYRSITEIKTVQLMVILDIWDVRCSTEGGKLLIDGMFGHLVADRWFMAERIKVWRLFHNRIYCSNYSILCSISPYQFYPNCSCKICWLLQPLRSSERIKDMAQRRHTMNGASLQKDVQPASFLIPQWVMSLSLRRWCPSELLYSQPQAMQRGSHGQEPNVPT